MALNTFRLDEGVHAYQKQDWATAKGRLNLVIPLTLIIIFVTFADDPGTAKHVAETSWQGGPTCRLLGQRRVVAVLLFPSLSSAQKIPSTLL